MANSEVNFTVQFLMFLLVPTVSSDCVRNLSTTQKKVNMGERFRVFFIIILFCICSGGVLFSFGCFCFGLLISPCSQVKFEVFSLEANNNPKV